LHRDPHKVISSLRKRKVARAGTTAPLFNFDGKVGVPNVRACARTIDMNTNFSAVPEPMAIDPETGDFERIGELAKQFGITLRTLRFYEDKGLISPKRDGVMRLYTRRDKARLKLILLGRKVGFSLREVKQMLDLYEPSGSNTRQLRVALDKSEKQLVRLERQRALIDDAIGELTGAMEIVRADIAKRTSENLRQSN